MGVGPGSLLCVGGQADGASSHNPTSHNPTSRYLHSAQVKEEQDLLRHSGCFCEYDWNKATSLLRQGEATSTLPRALLEVEKATTGHTSSQSLPQVEQVSM